jgi:hypothetical protein
MTEIRIPSRALGELLRYMFGPKPPPEKPEEIMRWEDDGGPLGRDYEEWTHEYVVN